MKSTIIEKRVREGLYGIPMTEAIIQHPKHGRMYVREGFGGGDVEGQTYRWRHGLAARLLDTDTLESLRRPDEYGTDLEGIELGCDPQRETLILSGPGLVNLVRAAGL